MICFATDPSSVCISLSCEPLDPGARPHCTAQPSLHKTALKINNELLHMKQLYPKHVLKHQL